MFSATNQGIGLKCTCKYMLIYKHTFRRRMGLGLGPYIHGFHFLLFKYLLILYAKTSKNLLFPSKLNKFHNFPNKTT